MAAAIIPGARQDGPASPESGAKQYPLEFCEANKVLFDSEMADRVRVFVCDPDDRELVDLLKFHHRKEIDTVPIDAVEFSARLGRIQANLPNPQGGSQDAPDSQLILDKIANDAPIINLVNSILLEAIRANASDIHVECFSDYAIVRFRIDGVLATAQRLPRERFAAVATRLKIMAGLNIMERRLPQDGRISADIGADRVDLRVSFIPIARGESVVLRLFNKSSAPMTLETLGLDPDSLGAIERLLKYPHGLILITGPTGSGKTTTFNAMIRRLKSDELKIVTIEDPIENVIDGIDQIQTNEAIGLTFESLLRHVLRQDPNVVMVGEVRDAATADLVVRAAMTGHLVLTTLHTNDAVSAVSRLKNIGVEPYMLSGVLRGVIAQRLVRRLCPHCAEPSPVKPAEKAAIQRWGTVPETLPRAKGCPLCRQTGYAGRLPVFEHFLVGERLEEAIAHGARTTDLYSILAAEGFRALAKNGLAFVESGLTSLEELEREVGL
jgi:general secretion pathway protein E/type IV pilus assembly protein PilB